MTRHEIFRCVVSWLYPNICPCCNDEIIGYNEAFCKDCFSELEEYDGDFPIKNVDKFIACCYYTPPMSDVVKRLKEECEGNAYYAFAYCMDKAIRKYGLTEDIDLLISVPMTYEDEYDRGYNQTELIADELHFMLDKPHVKAMKKVKDTAEQKTLSGAERRKNVHGAFELRKGIYVQGKKVAIIDDVCTTGSTLSEIAGVLKDNGADSVIAITFAKTAERETKKEQV